MLKAIETDYKGIRFRSKIEALWAVFFDLCGLKWEYEPQGFKLDNGMWYLPDFLLHDIDYKGHSIDLYVEVKGYLSDKDRDKVLCFSESAPILLVGALPWGYTFQEMIDDIKEKYGNSLYYNSLTIDGFDEPVTLGIIGDMWDQKIGIVELYSNEVNTKYTEEAYYKARNYRFDHRR